MRIRVSRSSAITLSIGIFGLLSACASAPPHDVELDRAQLAYSAASDNPKVAQAAPEQLRQASDNLNQARLLEKQGMPQSDVDHYARLASEQVAAAQQLAAADESLAYIKQVGDQHSRILLVASQQATRSQADTARDDESQRENAQIQQQLASFDAMPSNRGMVLTLGSDMFATDEATLKSGSTQSIDRLAEFMRNNPKRNVRVEGYTDSTGGQDYNLALSARRADAVRTALISDGIAPQRAVTQAFGFGFPVASNDTSAGRQQNRRVEIVISDLNGDFPDTR